MARKRSQQFYFLFSLFLGISQSILAWKDAMMVCPNFLKCFTIFLKFSITCLVVTHRNDVFYFLSFLAFPIVYWLEKKLWWCFLIFWFFCYFFSNFLFWVVLKPIGTIFIIFSHSRPFPTYFGLKRSYDGVFFLKFFAIFLEFSITDRVGPHRNNFFLFSLIRGLS